MSVTMIPSHTSSNWILRGMRHASTPATNSLRISAILRSMEVPFPCHLNGAQIEDVHQDITMPGLYQALEVMLGMIEVMWMTSGVLVSRGETSNVQSIYLPYRSATTTDRPILPGSRFIFQRVSSPDPQLMTMRPWMMCIVSRM